ncbi:hypothetical protein OPV22_029575 [Ensete ventricosum]|uniref:Uncharacterized protein n=1 Tax=Ensete ventricosum TaxID=4639 RepID=A0AAV8Q9L9_ENSVE|nr:hypothetical protein OPV22_029575 [Ensete ventricosum]
MEAIYPLEARWPPGLVEPMLSSSAPGLPAPLLLMRSGRMVDGSKIASTRSMLSGSLPMFFTKMGEVPNSQYLWRSITQMLLAGASIMGVSSKDGEI